MMIKKFAPIAIHTLNRHEHFIRCVESLSRCKYADQTELYIGLDYPLKKSHWEGYNIILEYLPTIKGFKSVNIFKREYNYGAYANSIQLKADIFRNHDIIFSTEDDNEFSANTLEYINCGLEQFKNNDSIYGICTSHHQIRIPDETTGTYFIMDSFSPMGFATWKEKYVKYSSIDKKEYIIDFLNNYDNYKQFRVERLHVIGSMLESLSKNYILGDAVVTSYIIKNKMKCVFPIIHKVKNHGYDGSGVNTGSLKIDNPYRDRIIDLAYDFVFIEEKNKHVISNIRSNIIISFKQSTFKKIFITVRYLLYYYFNIQFSSRYLKKIYRKYF